MNTELNLLLQKLKEAGHAEIAKALKNGQLGKLDERQRMVLADMSICVKLASRQTNLSRLRGVLVEVTTSDWGREPDSTERGLIQPLMNL